MSALAVTSWGSGEPLALLHGFTGAGSSFDHLRGALGTRFRVLAPDLPGHGLSPPATSWDDALLALHEALGPGPLFLGGYSLGARLALAYTLRFPAAVRGLALESGTPGIASAAERAQRRVEDAALEELLVREGVSAFVQRWEAHPTLASLRDLPAPLATSLRARRLGQTAIGLRSALRQLGTGAQPSLWDRLAEVDVPVLLIAGARDAKFTGIAREMKARLPHAHLEVIPDCGHSPHLEWPQRTAAALIGFLTLSEGAGP
jgi:2-succinyl-6-hydroxy-2,4-cyclohexadiene-1-carboxylate synthase